MHPFGTPLIITEPTSTRRGSSTLSRLRAALEARGMAYDLQVVDGITNKAGDVAREAVTTGRGYLIAVGGDGIVHRIVNGLVDADTATVCGNDPVLAIVAAASGSDLIRTFGLDRAPEVVAGHLVTGTTTRIDLGRIRLTGTAGSPTTIVFANIAQVGLGGALVAARAPSPRRLGRTTYATGVMATLRGFRRVPTTVAVDGGARTDPVCNVVVANGQFTGGGMLVAPRALPSDGRFNVQTWGGTVLDALRVRRLLARGAHLQRDDVREWQSASAEVHGRRPLLVEADGELVGSTPAQFEVLPKILRLKT